MGSWGIEDMQQGGGWRTGRARWQLTVPPLPADKPGGTTGSKTDHATQGSRTGK